MNIKVTISFLVIAILLGVWFIVFESDPKPKPDEDDTASNKNGEVLIEDFTKANYNKVTLTNADGKQFVAEREASNAAEWVQTTPINFPLQAHKIEDILTHIGELRYVQTVEASDAKITPEKMGLKTPQMTMKLEGKGQEPVVLKLGRKGLVGKAYLRVGDSGTAYVVNDTVHEDLIGTSFTDFRQNSVIRNLTPGNAVKVILKRGDETIELHKKEGLWSLADGHVGRADKGKVEALVSAVSSAWVEKFVKDSPESLGTYGLENPDVMIEIVTQDTSTADTASSDESSEKKPAQPEFKTYTFAIGSATDLTNEKYFAYANNVPVVFTVNKSTRNKFDVALNELRDPRLTTKPKSDITEITQTRSDNANLHLIKEEGVWKFGEPKPAFKLEPAQAENLLSLITETKAEDFVTYTPNDRPAQPIATIKMAIIASAEDETLRVYPHDDKHFVVVRNTEPVGAVVPKDQLELVTADLIAYRNLNILDLTEPDLKTITVKRAGVHPATYVYERSIPTKAPTDIAAKDNHGQWKLDNFDQQRFITVVRQLTPLRAEEWVKGSEGSSDADNVIQVSVVTHDGKTYELSVDTSNNTGQLSGQETRFQVNAGLVEVLQQELKNRVVLNLDPANIASVTVNELAIKRSTQGQYRIPGDKPVSESRVGTIFDTIAGLTVERYVDAAKATGEPTHTFVIDTRGENSKSYTLTLWKSDDPVSVAKLGDKVFTLNKSVVDKLTGDPVKQEGETDQPAPGGIPNFPGGIPGLPGN